MILGLILCMSKPDLKGKISQPSNIYDINMFFFLSWKQWHYVIKWAFNWLKQLKWLSIYIVDFEKKIKHDFKIFLWKKNLTKYHSISRNTARITAKN